MINFRIVCSCDELWRFMALSLAFYYSNHCISLSLFVCTLSFRELLIKSKSIYHMSWYCFLVVFDRSRFYAIGNANCGKRAAIVLFNYKHGYLLLFCHVFIDWFVVSIKFIFITFFLSIFCHPIELNLSIVINYILMGNVYAVPLAFFIFSWRQNIHWHLILALKLLSPVVHNLRILSQSHRFSQLYRGIYFFPSCLFSCQRTRFVYVSQTFRRIDSILIERRRNTNRIECKRTKK